MGLFGEVIGKIGLEYKAEVEQAKAKVRELGGEQKKQAREAAEALDRQAKAHEAMVTRVTAAIGVAVAAYAVARTGLQAYEQQTRLVGATAGIQIAALRKASGGLKTDIELLTLAADGMNGKFNLTQAEIEQVLVGMRALSKEGKDQALVAKAIGDAVKKGEIEPLKEAGIVYDEAIAKVDKKRALLEALGGAAKRAGGNLTMASDETKQMGVSFENSTNRIRAAIGQVVTAAAPAVESFAKMAEQLARIAGGIARIVDEASDLPGAGVVGWGVRNAWRFTPHGNLVTGVEMAGEWLGGGSVDSNDPFYRRDAEAEARVLSRYADTSTPGAAYLSPQQRQDAMFYLETAVARGQSSLRRGNRAAERARRRARPGRGTPRPRLDLASYGRSALDALGSVLTFDEAGQVTDVGGLLEDFGQMGTAYTPDEMEVLVERSKAYAADLGEFMEQLKAKQRESLLTTVFGPIEKFNAYAGAFQTLKTAAQAAMQAWIDGSMSAGKAFKQSVAQQIGAQSVELLGLGITSGAWGFYHLATGNPKGVGELAASGKAFAGAAALGLLAKSLGGNTVGAQGPGVGASAAGVGGGRVPAGEPRNITIVHGDVQADDSPRWRARRVQRDLATYSRHYEQPDGSYQG